MLTPERIREVLLMFAPLGIGFFLIVYGFIRDDWGLVSIGAGLVGVPGVNVAVEGARVNVGRDPRIQQVPVEEKGTDHSSNLPDS